MTTTTKKAKLGTVNGFVICTVWEAEGKVVAQCADTPNARAYAFAKHPKALFTKAHYPGGAVTIRYRHEESQNRIVCSGWMSTDAEARYQSY